MKTLSVYQITLFKKGGTEKFKPSLYNSFYRGARGVIIVSDPVNGDHSRVSYWFQDERVLRDGTVIFSSSKNDLVTACEDPETREKYERNIKELEKYAKQNNSRHIVTSAKTGLNVERIFLTLVQEVLHHREGFCYTARIWRAGEESTKEWGNKFKKLWRLFFW